MKRMLKRMVPLLLAVGILASIGWYLLVYDREFTRDFLISQARFFDSRGNVDFAAQLYDLAYDYTGKDEDVAIELANQYKADGNYTKAEYTLTNAIADGGTVDLYTALCKIFVEQDKLLDAVAMLDNIADPALKMEMDRLRPAAPEFTLAPGYYNQYITLEPASDEGILLCTFDHDYPSIQDAPFTEPVTLPSGETTIYAIRVAENGLVSPLAIMGYTIHGIIEEVEFTDPAIELALRELLGTRDKDPVMTDQLWEITEFTIPADAQSLTDLSYLPNLEKLTMQERRLDSLHPLACLTKLNELDLSGCRFPAAELEVLSEFQNLEKLNLSNCGLSTISQLSGAKNLTCLDLSNNTLRNLEPLTSMASLQELHLQHNAVTSLTSLAQLTELTKLDISYNSVTDIGALTSCTKLTWLNAGNNQIDKIDGIDAFSALTHLYLNQNKLINVNILWKLTSLVELDLSDNEIGNIDALNTLVNLVVLKCANNKLVHFPAWPADSPLSILDLSHNTIGSLHPLSKLEELTYLYVDYNWLTSLDDVANCYRLVMVSAFGNDIDDVSNLTKHNIIVNYDPT